MGLSLLKKDMHPELKRLLKLELVGVGVALSALSLFAAARLYLASACST